MKKALFAVLILVTAQGLFGAPLCASAPATTLFTVLGVVGCQDGDKLYENFAFVGRPVQAQFQDVVSNNNHIVTVTPLGGDTWFEVDGSFSYDVTVLTPGWGVSVAGLDATPGISGAGSVTKTFSRVGSPDIVLYTQAGLHVEIPLNYTTFHVNVLVHPTSGGGIVNVTDQYLQGAIPEPATMALFGSGLLALGLIRRLRRS